jgi:hypothetical protein
MGMREDIMAVKNELEEVKEKSFGYELLEDEKKKRQFDKIIFLIVWLITFIALVGVTCYCINLLNDIKVVEDTTEVKQSNAENNNYIGNNGDITNGTNNN